MPKLHYFDARGGGEPIRLIFAFMQQPYDDIRYSGYEDANWQAFKPKTPFGAMPVLEGDDGHMIAQMSTIVRTLGCKFDIAGGDNVCDRALVDMYTTAIVEDWKAKWIPTVMSIITKGKDSPETQNTIKETIGKLQPNLQQFEKRLSVNSTGFLVGNKVSYADIMLFHALFNIESWDATALGSYPLLKGHKTKMENLPGIKEWLEKRPKSDV